MALLSGLFIEVGIYPDTHDEGSGLQQGCVLYSPASAWGSKHPWGPNEWGAVPQAPKFEEGVPSTCLLLRGSPETTSGKGISGLKRDRTTCPLQLH